MVESTSAVYCFDIDGTICSNTWGEYQLAEPYPEAIHGVNKLYDEGHKILLYTARGSTTGVDWRSFTEAQLADWGVKFHEVFFGKPTADVYVDDRAINTESWARAGFGVPSLEEAS